MYKLRGIYSRADGIKIHDDTEKLKDLKNGYDYKTSSEESKRYL